MEEGFQGQDYLRPAAVKAAVIPAGYRGRFGWHNLRHSLATFFGKSGFSMPVIQSSLRHTKPETTMHYLHRDNSSQMVAQEEYLKAIKMTA